MTDCRKHETGVARMMAGIPEINNMLFWRIGFCAGDPVALIELPDASGRQSILILRDIEMDRARRSARVNRVACPADFAPAEGLSGDRETATAQAAAECLRRAGATHLVADRTLPLIFADLARQAGVEVRCDAELWIAERRSKRADEIDLLRAAQHLTEQAVEMACRLVAGAEAGRDGVLVHEGRPLTSERVRAAIDHWLLDRGFTNRTPIVAGGPDGADCHDVGTGPLRTGEPIIIDVFPRNRQTRYNGDCTRTVVHGDVPDEVRRMHAAVCAAKAAAAAAIKAGVTGDEVHRATTEEIAARGYSVGLPGDGAPDSYCAIVHGTGHGVGLDVHEPPLLDFNGPSLVTGDVVTIEPGLYRRDLGGIRVEDMVVVTPNGCDNLNKISETLTWR